LFLPDFLLLPVLSKEAHLLAESAKITVEIGVFFQDRYLHASPREQITGHYTCRPTTHDYATCL
jgi:hypothetical protein